MQSRHGGCRLFEFAVGLVPFEGVPDFPERLGCVIRYLPFLFGQVYHIRRREVNAFSCGDFREAVVDSYADFRISDVVTGEPYGLVELAGARGDMADGTWDTCDSCAVVLLGFLSCGRQL